MPWTGSAPNETFQRTDGTRTGSDTWKDADNAGVRILSADHDTHDEDLGDGISACLKKDGGNQANANIPMGGFTLTNIGNASARTSPLSAGQAADGAHNWYGNLGGTDTYTLSATSFSPSAYTLGQVVNCRVVNANTGAVTVNINSLGAKSVVRLDNTALSAGDWPAGAVVSMVYDTNLGKFVWSGYPNKLADDTVDTAAIANAGVTEAKLSAGLQTLLTQIRQKIGIGAGRLTYSSATQLKLIPFNGELISFPDGTQLAIPSAGVTVDTTGLSSSTLYRAYAYDNSGSLALELAATGHATDSTTGIEIKSGDTTRVLVGMAYTNGSTQFTDSATARLVASWHNRTPKQLLSEFSTERSTTAASLTEVHTEIRCEFVSWGDALSASFSGAINNPNNVTRTGISLDGSTSSAFVVTSITTAAGGEASASISGVFAPSEGHHYVTVLGQVNSGTGKWRANFEQSKLTVLVQN